MNKESREPFVKCQTCINSIFSSCLKEKEHIVAETTSPVRNKSTYDLHYLCKRKMHPFYHYEILNNMVGKIF